MDLIFIGNAASGKTSLTKNFGEFLIKKGYNVKRINLDPAASFIPYEADFDIRKYYDFRKFMNEYKLGPNGAMVKIFEEFLKNKHIVKKLKETINGCDFSLIDTPGQMEIFLFHESLKELLGIFKKPIIILLIDGEKYNRRDSILLKIFNLLIYLKYDVKSFSVITKKDIINKQKIEEGGEIVEIYEKLHEIFKEFELPFREIFISNNTWEGFDEMLNMIYEVFCICGDYV